MAKEIYEVKGRKITRFRGDIMEYKKVLMKASHAAAKEFMRTLG